ncbi:unnamed protein product [Fusarium equiseti]|uniref:Uncharacterized protein n=1 Tax=Fusarium equiseti TaxID=61235 RepID=A0A8J2IQA9_FUSEQ|nr:unnamed protein product [Fusarium equiseti]
MTLESDFPDDPTQPSLRYAVSTQMPLALPWTNASMQMGKCLLESSKGTEFQFGNETAFDKGSLHSTPLVFATTRTGQHNQATHNKASVYTSFRCGKITLAQFPRLSEDAIRILQTSTDPSRTFQDKFGDYFVGGYILGGMNMTTMWGDGSSESASERLDISFEVHLLFLSYEDSIRTNDVSSTSRGSANLTAFDSLDAYQTKVDASDYGSYRMAVEKSVANRRRGAELQQRVLAKLNDLGLDRDRVELSWEKCDELCKSGLVLELLMLPWTGLREYREALLKPR